MKRVTRSASRQLGPSKKPRLARDPSIVEIIELSDSDNDLPMRPAPKRVHSQPGSSRKTSQTFGKQDAEMLADAGASTSRSSHCAANQRDGQVPLFLPGSDDERHAVHPPVSVAQNVPDAPCAHPQPLPPEPASEPVNPIDGHIARVLEIVPDVQPNHALSLIEQLMQSQPENVVEFVLHALFENPSYPKVDKKGKHKRDEPDDDPNARASPKPRIDYASKARVYNCGPHYFECSLVSNWVRSRHLYYSRHLQGQLMMDFPRIPKPHIRSRLLANQFYAPTYLLLAEELKKEPLPFKLKSTNSVVSKGKARQDPEFDKEREWVLLRLTELAAERDAALAASAHEQECLDNGEGIECGCCFSEYPFVRANWLSLPTISDFLTGPDDSVSRSSPFLQFLHDVLCF